MSAEGEQTPTPPAENYNSREALGALGCGRALPLLLGAAAARDWLWRGRSGGL